MLRMCTCCGLLLLAVGVTGSQRHSRLQPAASDKRPRSGKAEAVAIADPEAKGENAAEKTRKALDQVVDLEFQKQPLSQVAEELQKLTKVAFVLDRRGLPQVSDPSQETQVSVHLDRVKLRSGLRRLLSPYNLGYAIIGDTVLITTADLVVERQMEQQVNVHLDEVPLSRALQQLGRGTATNVVVDRRAAKEAQTPLTMHLEEVPLESAVRLLAAMADLKPVRVANVLFVTTEAGAARLEPRPVQQPYVPYLLPVAPCLGGMVGGACFGGIGGLGGCHGFGGGALGIGGGALGIGGGALGIGGGTPAGFETTGSANKEAGEASLVLRARTTVPGLFPSGLPLALGDEPAAKQQPQPAAQPVKQPPPRPEAPARKEAPKAPTRAGQLRSKLSTAINFEFPGGPLKEALEYLGDRYGLMILIDTRAFKEDDLDIPEVESAPVKVPKLADVSLRTVLRLLLAQASADFQLQNGRVTVLPRTRIASGRMLLQPVDAAFNERPLHLALQELSDLTGASINVDNRAAPAKTAVTANFDGVPLETAVRVLADVAGLKPVALDNSLYVTTKENARELQAEEEARKLKLPRMPRAEEPKAER